MQCVLQSREEQVVAMEAHMQHFVNTWRSDENEDSSGLSTTHYYQLQFPLIMISVQPAWEKSESLES